MTPEVATQVMGYDNAKDLWAAIQELFGVQSRAEEDYLRQTFQQTRKGSLKMADYLRVMKTYADNLGQAGSPVSTRSLISQVLLGLDEEYNPIVATLQGRTGVAWAELQADLLVFEKRLDLQNSDKNNLSFSHNSPVNMVNTKNQGSGTVRQNQPFSGNGPGFSNFSNQMARKWQPSSLSGMWENRTFCFSMQTSF